LHQIFLDSVEEPYFMAPLDYALVNFHTDISPWTCARDWIDADVSQIRSAIQVLAASTQRAGIESANFGGDMIYQVCLIALIFK
jgi:hypothetical protein